MDPNDPTRLVFLRWQNGIANMVPSIEHAGTVYLPPDRIEALHSQIILSGQHSSVCEPDS